MKLPFITHFNTVQAGFIGMIKICLVPKEGKCGEMKSISFPSAGIGKSLCKVVTQGYKYFLLGVCKGLWGTLAATSHRISPRLGPQHSQPIKVAAVPCCSGPFAPHPAAHSCRVLMSFARSDKMPV